jgi:hypothetical protein
VSPSNVVVTVHAQALSSYPNEGIVTCQSSDSHAHGDDVATQAYLRGDTLEVGAIEKKVVRRVGDSVDLHIALT